MKNFQRFSFFAYVSFVTKYTGSSQKPVQGSWQRNACHAEVEVSGNNVLPCLSSELTWQVDLSKLPPGRYVFQLLRCDFKYRLQKRTSMLLMVRLGWRHLIR